MERSATCNAAPAAPTFSTRRWPDWALLAVLLTLATAIHAWQVAHTLVAARDSIGYIRYALQMQERPWREVLRQADQHPIYPLSVLAVSLPVRQLMGGTTCDAMVLSCQLASSFAGVLLVIPMFYLGRELFDRRVGFWAAALFQCLPVSAHVTADALTEAAYLLITATMLLLAARSLRDFSIRRFALCGLCGGLAYLTRPEGALTVVAVFLVLLGTQAVPAWRRSWKRTSACAASLVVAAAVVGIPYMVTIGGFTIKPTANHMFEKAWADVSAAAAPPRGSSGPLFAALPAIWWNRLDSPPNSWCLYALGFETVKSFQYLLLLPVLLGVWWFRGRLRSSPGAWVLALLCLMNTLILWRLARVMGYLSDRHVQLLVLCGTFWGMAMVLAVADWLAKVRGWRWASWALPVMLIGFGAPSLLKPLHSNRVGYRAAGLWLAEHANPLDRIDDPFCWAHFYAGRVFQEGKTLAIPAGYQPHRYVIVEDSSNPHVRLPMMEWVRRLAKRGTLVYQWQPRKPSKDQPGVLVYSVPPEG